MPNWIMWKFSKFGMLRRIGSDFANSKMQSEVIRLNRNPVFSMSHFHISKSTYDELKNRHAAEEKNYLDQAETLAWDIHKKAQAIIDMTGFSPAIALEIAAGKVDVIDATLSGCHWSPEFEGVVQEIIANTRNRSDVSKTNESAQLLAKLEWEFQGNEKELAKIKSIAVVDDEHIRIAGFTHKL